MKEIKYEKDTTNEEKIRHQQIQSEYEMDQIKIQNQHDEIEQFLHQKFNALSERISAHQKHSINNEININ